MAEAETPAQSGPQMSRTMHEVQALMPSDAALQDAINRLKTHGIDHADISVIEGQPRPADNTPEQGAENPYTEEDNSQLRTMHASMAGTIGAMAAAGAIIATGGAAAVGVATAAAIGAAIGGGAMTETGSLILDSRQHERREKAAREGRLVIAVTVRDPAREGGVQEALRGAGATRVESVTYTDEGVDSTAWTGGAGG